MPEKSTPASKHWNTQSIIWILKASPARCLVFGGEKPFSQSLFQYSVHVGKENRNLREIADNYGFLARDFSDCREELVRSLLRQSTLERAARLSFTIRLLRKTGWKNWPICFGTQAQARTHSGFAFWFATSLKINKKFYQKLGFSGEEESGIINYYHRGLQWALFHQAGAAPVFRFEIRGLESKKRHRSYRPLCRASRGFRPKTLKS